MSTIVNFNGDKFHFNFSLPKQFFHTSDAGDATLELVKEVKGIKVSCRIKIHQFDAFNFNYSHKNRFTIRQNKWEKSEFRLGVSFDITKFETGEIDKFVFYAGETDRISYSVKFTEVNPGNVMRVAKEYIARKEKNARDKEKKLLKQQKKLEEAA